MVRPRVAVIGTVDVHRRIELMQALASEFDAMAVGSTAALKPEFEASGFEYFSYRLSRPDRPTEGVRAFRDLVRLLGALKPDLVHTFDTVPSIWGRLAARVARVPAIVGTLPGLGRLYTQTPPERSPSRYAYEALQRVASRQSDVTIFQNTDDARRMIAAGIVPETRVRVIPGSGIMTDRVIRSSVSVDQIRAVRAELDAGPETVIVLMVAELLRTKGVTEFAKAARILSEKHSNVRFVLVGAAHAWRGDALSPEERDRVQQSVCCLGTRSDVPVLMAAADIFVLPTYYGEGIPRVLLEAASMELPIVTTDWPGCRDVVRDSVNGFLVAPREVEPTAAAIERLIINPALRQSLGAAARHRAVTEFDLRVVAQQTAAVYRDLLATRVAH